MGPNFLVKLSFSNLIPPLVIPDLGLRSFPNYYKMHISDFKRCIHQWRMLIRQGCSKMFPTMRQDKMEPPTPLLHGAEVQQDEACKLNCLLKPALFFHNGLPKASMNPLGSLEGNLFLPSSSCFPRRSPERPSMLLLEITCCSPHD